MSGPPCDTFTKKIAKTAWDPVLLLWLSSHRSQGTLISQGGDYISDHSLSPAYVFAETLGDNLHGSKRLSGTGGRGVCASVTA